MFKNAKFEFIPRIKRSSRISTKWLFRKIKRFTTPGLNGVPVVSVIRYFFKGIVNGAITTRASSVAFSFFLATVPTLIFIFSLIPHIPVSNFQAQLLSVIKGIMPMHAYQTVEATLIEVVTTKSTGLLSFGFLAALFFSHNGVSSLIDAFNATYHAIETRSFIQQHIIAFLLTIILPLIVIVGAALIFFSEYFMNLLLDWGLIKLKATMTILLIGKWILVVVIFFIGISTVYYLAPAQKEKFRFFSPGALLATVLIVITSLGFSYYVNQFGQYNKFYGSLGGLIVFQIWLYFNAFGLILGFDLNASIRTAINSHHTKIDLQIE
ncbi:MAG: YihY/virulence factor BrkB family protein [Bacteroidales bacterium]